MVWRMGTTGNAVRDGARHVSLVDAARQSNRSASAVLVLRTGGPGAPHASSSKRVRPSVAGCVVGGGRQSSPALAPGELRCGVHAVEERLAFTVER